MTKCKECGNEISTKADACPQCGAKQVRTSGCAKFVLIFLGLIFAFYVIGQFSHSPLETSSLTTSPTTSFASASQATPAAITPPPAPVPSSQWTYSRGDDKMSKGVSYGALVKSKNTVEFDFPYSGPQNATLTLRTHPRYGKDVIFSIERGQFLCQSYEDCTILVRFDDQKAQKYQAIGAADNSTENIFIRNYSRFVGSMLKAKTVRIAANIYQEGAPVFEFDVSGFDVSKYKRQQ